MITKEYLEENKDNVNWRRLIRDHGNEIDECLLEEYKSYVPWGLVARKCKSKLSEEFIERNLNKLNFTHVIRFCKVNSDFIIRHEDLMNEECWSYVTKYSRIKNIDFLNNYKDKLKLKAEELNLIINICNFYSDTYSNEEIIYKYFHINNKNAYIINEYTNNKVYNSSIREI